MELMRSRGVRFMRILMAEDDPGTRSLLKVQLVNWGYDVVVTRDGSEAWQVLQADDAPRLAILDWMMPGMTGVELCRKVREEKKEPYTYIILLTAQQRDEYIVTGMEAGADDYMLKPFNYNELKVRLRAGRRIIELQNELIEAREIFQEKANRDSLTGLLNHEEILGALDQELARAEREGKCVSVIMADLDHFKMVNDTYGHMAGDAVLRSVAKRMHSLTRSYDYVGRYGGEEFLVILPECCKECAVTFAERLSECISSERMDTSEGEIPVTVSLGVSASGKDRGWNAQALVRSADEALYLAKKNGRNRVEIAADDVILEKIL